MPDPKHKILMLVEDNPDDEELTRMAFAASNLMNEIVVAHDGVEALDFLFATGAYTGRDLRVTPQVVLLDLKLPKIGGLEVLRRIRADPRTATLPVVILTSSQEEEDIARGYQLGANAYVRKPVDFSDFREAAKQLGLFWFVVNQAPPNRTPPAT